MKNSLFFILITLVSTVYGQSKDYPVVDTGTTDFYSDTQIIQAPSAGEQFYGQDANYSGLQPSYTDNGDGTITDNVTGLMWQKIMGSKLTLESAKEQAENLLLGGYNDWRIPSIKELYSLILFTGRVSGQKAGSFFIDTEYFDHPLGDTALGEREIDAQTWSATEYVGRTMGNDETIFGVNFVDGRIKGYPKYNPRNQSPNKMYFRFVRGNTDYGNNRFEDNNDGTITDHSTGLMWQKADSGTGMDWEAALEYAQGLALSGYEDWRLPNAKELQSLVDYARSPETSQSAAIDPLFEVSEIINPNGDVDFPFFWTSTTHLEGQNPYSNAVYICFGRALGRMRGEILDVHGAGAQRSDPKSGPESGYPSFFGPQGDIRYVYNYVRCVRSVD